VTPQCPECGKDVLDIDVKCPHCDAPLAASGAHKMIGQVMLGQYELVDILGQGGMSVVFKGKHKMTDQEVALKILPPELAAHQQVKSRFLEEAKALAALDHANIVHLYNFGQESGFFVLAMQFVQGQTWERMIIENKRLDWKASCKIAIDVLRALEYAHGRGVIHRDMKPSNVLVKRQDGSATVMDFGIAKMTTSTRLTATGQTMGTVRYMSPEQVRGQEVDHKTDIYSLGATLYESLTGDTPFDGETHFDIMTKHLSEPPKRPSTMGIEVPLSIEDALMRSLAKKASDRFETARDMRKVLEQALRAADPGLDDTQRVSGEVISDLRSSVNKAPAKNTATPTVPEAAPTQRRVATANDLAEELEPGIDLDRPPRSRWPLIAFALLVLAGGAVVAVMILRDNEEPPKPKPPPKVAEAFPEIPMDELVVGKVRVRVAKSAKLSPQDIGTAYEQGVARVQAEVDKISTIKIDPVAEIDVVPRAAICTPSAYPDSKLPNDLDCMESRYVVAGLERRLYLVAEQWSQQLDLAIADAAFVYEPNEERAKVLRQVARKLAQPKEAPKDGSAKGSADKPKGSGSGKRGK
jgi:serine/threonine protein kinase